MVLDPDHGYAFGVWDGVTYGSFAVNLEVAQGVQALLPSVCDANISLTQTADSLSNAARAAQMQSADVAVTLSMDGLFGTPWGASPSEGGSKSFATPRSDDLAFGDELVQQVGAFTGRPFDAVNTGPTKGETLPYPEFDGLSGTYAQVFMLYMDNNYDFPVWHDNPQYLINAVTTAIAHTLMAKGFKCLGTFPARPSAAELQRLRNLGYQQFLRYGAEPVSMSTGNFSTAEKTIRLTGVGNQVIDLTLDYNAQSGQDSPVGFGWDFAYGDWLQQYSDGSVLINLSDGRALLYTPDGGGGFTGPPGAFASLTQVDSSTFTWTTTTGTKLTFLQDVSGRAKLTGTEDRQGNTETLTYGGDGSLFPKLASITDQAGQHVTVATDDSGRITSFTRPDGTVWHLAYSDGGDLASLTLPSGNVRQFHYDDQHRMTSEVGQDGITFLTNAYDAKSRVVDQTNAFGQHRSFVYDDTNRVTTYTDATGASTVYHWDALGQVTQVDDALGGITKTDYNGDLQPVTDTNALNNSTHRGYDPSGQVSSVTDPLGNETATTYNSAGDLTSKTDAGGDGGSPRTYSYSVNGQGLPTTITNPDATTQSRTYDAAGDLTSSSDENGNTTHYQYDSRGNLVRTIDPLGRETTKTYDLANRLASTTDPLGHTTKYTYDADDNLTETTYPNGSTELRKYDVNDQLISLTDRRGAVTKYSYDAELNLVSTTLPNGGVTKNTYDNEDRLTSTTDPLGNTTKYTLDALGRRIATTDANGNTTKTSYDAAGQVISQTDANGNVTHLQRDANGQVVKTTDPAGGATFTTFDAVGRRTTVTDPLGHTTKYTYTFRDEIATTTDPAGGVVTQTYDNAGRLIKKTDPTGAVTRYSYDAAGQLVKITDPLGGTTTYIYDADGNQTSVTDPNGHTVSMMYNSMNEQVSKTDANGHITTLQRDAGGLLTTQIDPLGNQTSRTYDAMGDLTSTTDGLGRTTQTGYDFNQQRTSQTAPDGVVTAYSYDPVGNLTKVVENWRSGQPASNTVNVTTRYSYDARNLRVSMTDPNGAMTHYGYDVRGLLTSVANPLGKITNYSYDAAGNTASRQDANGAATQYSYDPRNLLTKRAYPGGTADTFGYDAAGRQTSATNSTGVVAITFDDLGRITKVNDAAGKSLQYSYDPAGNRISMTLPDGRSLSYSYDFADNLTKLTSPLGTETFSYDDANRLATVTRPNGTTTSVAFDAANELTKLITTAGSSTLASFAYNYDSAGNVGARAQNLGGNSTTTTYTYDQLRRLTRATDGPLPSTYTYDAAGNRLTWSAPDDPYTPKPGDSFTQTNVVNAAGQVTKQTMVRQNGSKTDTTVTTDTYDANGNRLRMDTVAQSPGQSTSTVYTYNFENQLLSSTPGNTPQKGDGNNQRNLRRTYDALGRIVTESRDTTTTWTSDGFNPVQASDPTAGTTLYLRDAAGQLQGESTTGLTPLWYVKDLLGSVVASTNTNDKPKLANVTQYSDYGVKLGKTYSRMGFGGQISDPSYPGNGIGNDTPVLSHYYARSYDPGTGTWMQPDPLPGTAEQPSTQQPYRFTADNPTTNTDLLGYVSIMISGGSLQGGSWTSTQVLQPTVSVQQLQPAANAQQLQPTANPMFHTYRSPRAYGQVEWTTIGPVSSDVLQGDSGLGLGSIGEVPNKQSHPSSSYLLFGDLQGWSFNASTVRGGITPVLQGQAGVALAARTIELQGWSIVGEEVTIQTTMGRFRIDLVARNGSGDLRFIEVKTGPNADLTINQQITHATFKEAGGQPVGANATEAGLPTDEPLSPKEIELFRVTESPVKFPVDLPDIPLF